MGDDITMGLEDKGVIVKIHFSNFMAEDVYLAA
jgi:hypothetical protein